MALLHPKGSEGVSGGGAHHGVSDDQEQHLATEGDGQLNRLVLHISVFFFRVWGLNNNIDKEGEIEGEKG